MSIKYVKEEMVVTEQEESDLKKLISDVITEVEKNGDRAVKDFTKRFDKMDLDRIVMNEEEINEKIENLSEETKEIIDYNISRIKKFAEFQLSMYKDMYIETDNGEVTLGQRIIPIESVGVYVPGGRFPLISSALMGIVPAKVAGVKRVVAATPPGIGKPDPAVLYGIVRSGADEIINVGGAQAIAAMAIGTESLRPVDKIVGPGNKYVNEAKRQIFGKVGIDLLAGPSEVLILADDTANLDEVIYDLLAQAEHDVAARSCLITTSKKLADMVNDEIAKYINTLSTYKILEVSWLNKGSIVLCDSLDEAIAKANEYAPEHLEVHLSEKSQKKAFDELKNYGSLFLNHNTPVVLSDKLIGTNHTLPTNRAARYTGGLSVGAFLKILTYQEVKGQNAKSILSERAYRQSKIEGLGGHAKSAELRVEKMEK